MDIALYTRVSRKEKEGKIRKSPLSFRNCANGTSLPLTAPGPDARMARLQIGKIFATRQGAGRAHGMSGRVVVPVTAEGLFPVALPLAAVRGILEAVDGAVLVADRRGQLLAGNRGARQFLGLADDPEMPKGNLFL